MAKIKTSYICSECGFESPKWYGKCPSCGEWNTLNEELNSQQTKNSFSNSFSTVNQVLALDDIAVKMMKEYLQKLKNLTGY